MSQPTDPTPPIASWWGKPHAQVEREAKGRAGCLLGCLLLLAALGLGVAIGLLLGRL